MSFGGFDNQNLASASLKNAKKITHKPVFFEEDPAASMMPDENKPITDAQIKRAAQKKKQAEQRAARQKQLQAKKAAKKQQELETQTSTASGTQATSPVPVEKASETPAEDFNPNDIISVQKRQKELENQNKLRRQALDREVQNRTQNVLAEAAKLKKIDNEIKKLDELLSYDVSILRDKIDAASYEYNKSRTRFLAAELEYKESKKEFEDKEKEKNDLTQALMTLIQENEERKRTKLESLVMKLNMGADELAKLEQEEEAKRQAEEKRLKELAEQRKKEEAEAAKLEKERLEKEEKERLEREEKERLEKDELDEIKKDVVEKENKKLAEEAIKNFEKETTES